jgi:hypothetical protein
MQELYTEMIGKLGNCPEPGKSRLIKAVSATKTALENLDRKVASDDVTKSVEGFTGVLVAINSILSEAIFDVIGCPIPTEITKDEQPVSEQTEFEEPVKARKGKSS